MWVDPPKATRYEEGGRRLSALAAFDKYENGDGGGGGDSDDGEDDGNDGDDKKMIDYKQFLKFMKLAYQKPDRNHHQQGNENDHDQWIKYAALKFGLKVKEVKQQEQGGGGDGDGDGEYLYDDDDDNSNNQFYYYRMTLPSGSKLSIQYDSSKNNLILLPKGYLGGKQQKKVVSSSSSSSYVSKPPPPMNNNNKKKKKKKKKNDDDMMYETDYYYPSSHDNNARKSGNEKIENDYIKFDKFRKDVEKIYKTTTTKTVVEGGKDDKKIEERIQHAALKCGLTVERLGHVGEIRYGLTFFPSGGKILLRYDLKKNKLIIFPNDRSPRCLCCAW